MNNKKIIIIAGGHGLLGSEFAYTLSKDDSNEVIILDLPNKKINRLIKKTRFFPCDVGDEEDVQTTIDQIYDNYGRIDTLINCAAYNEQPDASIDNSFENYSLSRWNDRLSVNLNGAFLLSRECIKYMLKNKNEGFRGTIMNVTSQLGLVAPNQTIYNRGYKKPIAYCVAASGIISMTRYLASYYGSKIKINCLIPSMVENGQAEEFIKNVEKLIPIGRMSKKEEFNSAMKFLCSEDSSYMTGQILVCDGGYTSW